MSGNPRLVDFLQEVDSSNPSNLAVLLNALIRSEQVPQLSTSREIDVNDKFSLRNTAVSHE